MAHPGYCSRQLLDEAHHCERSTGSTFCDFVFCRECHWWLFPVRERSDERLFLGEQESLRAGAIFDRLANVTAVTQNDLPKAYRDGDCALGRFEYCQSALDSQPLVQLFFNFRHAVVPAADDC